MSLQNDFCSLCGVDKSQMNILQFEIMSKINQLFKEILCLSSSMNYSKYICSDCELSVKHFYTFWQMVQKVQKRCISFKIQHSEKSTNTLFPRLPIEYDEGEGGLNLCHTTGITEDSEPVLIKINVVKQFQCDVCKMGLCFSQLIALHQVTHGLGTVACQCEQCGHQDDIGIFLQDKTNVNCPKCSFRKINQVMNNSVDVQTQFISDKMDNEPQHTNSKETKNMEICRRETSDNMDIKYTTNGDVPKPSYSSDCTENLYQIDKYSTQSVYNRDQTGFPNEINYETIPPDCLNSHDYQMKTNSSCTLDEFKFNDSNYSRIDSYNSSSQNKNHVPTNYTPSRTHSVDNSDTYPSSSQNKNHVPANYTPPRTHSIDNSVNSDIYPSSGQNKNQKCHVCEVCSRVFNHKGHLTRHMLVHDKSIKHFLCDECGRRFNQKSSLVTHWIHVHCKEKSMDNQFQCVWCGQVYKHKMNLKSHLLNNHNKNSMLKTKFYCNICDKYFISTSRLNMHSKIHLSIKEFQCPICKKSFNQKNNLNIHLKKDCPPKQL